MNGLKSKKRIMPLMVPVMAVILLMFALAAIVSQSPVAGAQDAPVPVVPGPSAPLTPGQVAANGPMPGDVAAYQSEWDCIQGIETPGYFQSFNGGELTDAQRSGTWPCMTFTGSITGSSRVFAYRFPQNYEGAAYVNNRRPGEMYIVGGGNPPLTGIMPAGPYLAKVDATTGVELWRTYFDNGNVSGDWIGATNLNILPNGNIVHAWGDNVAIINGNTGLILKTTQLPTGEADPDGVNFKHVTIAPDGTLILKDQTRPIGLDLQGTTAIIIGNLQGYTQPNAVLVAVNPNTLEVLDTIDLPQPSTTPHVITEFDGKTAIYVSMNTIVGRYYWDPETQTLSEDADWQPTPTVEGQTTADAPGIIGDWVVLQTNGIGSSTVASSIVIVNQNDASNMQTIFPFGDLEEGGFSLAPPKSATDPDNNMIYSADMGMGMIAGISIDQDTGDMQTEFVLEQTSSTFQELIGPADNRTLVLSNLMTADDGTQYGQMTWNNAATGDLYAASDYFEPLTTNSIMAPGFGGRFYFPTSNGVIAMQVEPQPTEYGAAMTEDDTQTTTLNSAMSGEPITLTLQTIDNSRNWQYCELVFDYGDAGQDIYSTSPLAPCDLSWWDNLDLDQLAADFDANGVTKNGPEWWSMDTVGVMASQPVEVGGVEMVYGAVLPAGTLGTPQYQVFNTAKTQNLTWKAGQPTYQLVDPSGNVYVMQGYKVRATALGQLAPEFQELPEGWSYRVQVYAEDLVMNLSPAAPIPSVQDEFDQIYIRIPSQ